jgi:AcrR family transcriptional regulator
MPKVSVEHQQARRVQIVEAAWRRFADKGFGATSMRDVFEESGLSAGAVYSYFPSKADLVGAACEYVLVQVEPIFDELLAESPTPDPVVCLERVTAHALALRDRLGGDPARFAVLAWAEAAHDERVREVVGSIYLGVLQQWSALAERWEAEGTIRSGNPDATARVMLGLMLGFITQRNFVGDVAPASYAAGLATLSTR